MSNPRADWSWKPDRATRKALDDGEAKVRAYRAKGRQPKAKRATVQPASKTRN